jgi:hypothetical protein
MKITRWFILLLLPAIVGGCIQSNAHTPNLPAISPNAFDTPTPSSIPTTVPTLPVEDARKRLLDLLASNGDCRLPCLWGITPGKSSYLEARSILLPLSSVAETVYFDYTSSPVDDISPLYVEGDLRLHTRVAYVYGNDRIVNYIIFRALEERLGNDEYGNRIALELIFDSPTFMKRIQYYSLSHVLTEQGMPASVMIQASGWGIYSLELDAMDLVFLYPDQGIWVHYIMPSHFKQIDVEAGCPANAHIEMNLFPSGNPDSFYSLLDQTDWGMTKYGYKPLEEATSMSVKEFYETFRNPTDRCIETPANLWPTPESGGG